MSLAHLTGRSRWWIGTCVVGILIYFSSSMLPWQGSDSRVLHTLEYPLVLVEKIWLQTTKQLHSLWLNYIYLLDVQEENRKLKRENQRLQAQLLENSHYIGSIAHYRSLLDMQESLGEEAIPANIGAFHYHAGFPTLRIFKGYEKGIEEGMPVLFMHGLIGHVIRSRWGFADVQIITSAGVHVDVIVERTRYRGSIVGGNEHNLLRWQASQSADIEVGDTVLTSGMLGVYPKGIPVAQVSKIVHTQDALFQNVWLTLMEDIRSLEYVFVLKHENAILKHMQKEQLSSHRSTTSQNTR